jgi:hypothetical protein
MKIVVAAAAVAAISAAAPALAQDASQPSYGGLYGNLGWAGTDTHSAFTNSITGRLGWRFGRYVGVEGELSGGLSTDHFTSTSTGIPTTTGVKQSLAGAGYAVGFLPVGPSFDLLARVGYGASRYNISPSGSPDYHVSENGVRYGAGAQYFFDGRNGVRADFTREHMGDLHDAPGFFGGERNASVWAVSFAHKF